MAVSSRESGDTAQNEAEEVGRGQTERNEPLKGVLFSQEILCFVLFFSFMDKQLTYNCKVCKVYVVVTGYTQTS